MVGERAVKKLLEGKAGGGKKTGRPRLRWIDIVKLDLMNMSVEGWRTRALDSTEWACVMMESRAKIKEL